ncbi:glutamate-5-semialdehyde dehydrogenase [Oenococcus kitaharae]|nr:glutamate-5-semialdehyde dehydrogenase [Oenococcus kitaharae]OEY83425.1 gamma-glutamyl phosphate reductase [Oenococcus kitaharae]OEY85224.1 gamma-glutamyl phosphate reductase [Oenococcus kitaharae]OEY86078.1 gamma-glutamyl phosphate reductase [Oenococcus kitaharae]
MNDILHTQMIDIGQRAKTAALSLARLSFAERNAILGAFADAILANKTEILRVNQQELDEHHHDLTLAMQNRLALDSKKIAYIVDSLHALIKIGDPLAGRDQEWQAAAGFKILKKIVPLGVVAMIYEARPNVTIDAAALAVKSANAVILRGGKEAIQTNSFLAHILRETISQLGYNPDMVQLISDNSHASVDELLHARSFVDVLIPRGSRQFINHVVENASVPVIETGAGNDHIFVDESADQQQAIRIILNAKTQSPAVCNAAEKLLIHKDIAKEFLPKIVSELKTAGVEIRADAQALQLDPTLIPASVEDWDTEYNDLIMAVHIVGSLDEAISWISKHTTHHTEAILTQDPAHAAAFMNDIDAAVVMLNASTRFTDGFEFGFGSEIGISTQKLHARGPMGLKALTSYKYEVFGHGEVRK